MTGPGAAAGGDVVTVLVVEDNDAVRELVRLALEGVARRIVLAGSGAEAIAAAAGSPVDLLITDVVLPDVRGPELAAALRAEQPSLRVIYISGWFDHADFPSRGPRLTPRVVGEPVGSPHVFTRRGPSLRRGRPRPGSRSRRGRRPGGRAP